VEGERVFDVLLSLWMDGWMDGRMEGWIGSSAGVYLVGEDVNPLICSFPGGCATSTLSGFQHCSTFPNHFYPPPIVDFRSWLSNRVS
jgi:hypothetical protein